MNGLLYSITTFYLLHPSGQVNQSVYIHHCTVQIHPPALKGLNISKTTVLPLYCRTTAQGDSICMYIIFDKKKINIHQID